MVAALGVGRDQRVAGMGGVDSRGCHDVFTGLGGRLSITGANTDRTYDFFGVAV